MFAKARKTSSTSGRKAQKNSDLQGEVVANEGSLLKDEIASAVKHVGRVKERVTWW
jgi:hypothetical protein